ncbi:MAG TPA: Na+/H+ antiporter subunit E [Candidatus Binatia bacterium]|nr:Na+/H+ antiporter subunit E [Candidatus Binatia bacterium]
MRRLFPYPGLSFVLAVFWLLLHNSLAPATFVGAILVGVAAPLSFAPLEAPRVRIGSFVALLKLGGVVVYDIVRSNLAVAALILSGAKRRRTSGFVSIPLELRNQYGLALLAVIITSTPGTLWAQHDIAPNRLLLHVFDLVDESDWIDLVKRRYEPLLLEIFE